MKKIGGFLDLELSKPHYSNDSKALLLSTGRGCLNFILNKVKPKKIYIPYYTCDTVLEPILFNKIKFQYYSIDKNLNPQIFNINDGEYFYYINYFGLKGKIVRKLIKKFGEYLIIDNTQAFYEKGYKNIWSYNSARKFFGVSDGAYLFSPIDIKNDFKRNTKISYEHLIDSNKKNAYKSFLYNESLLSLNIEKISLLSEFILRNIDYDRSAKIRLENFSYLEKHLKHINQFKFQVNRNFIPLCYPLLLDKVIDKQLFFSKNLFIPTFWKREVEIIKNNYLFEKELPNKLIPLPIDQRYSKKEMKKIIYILKKYL